VGPDARARRPGRLNAEPVCKPDPRSTRYRERWASRTAHPASIVWVQVVLDYSNPTTKASGRSERSSGRFSRPHGSLEPSAETTAQARRQPAAARHGCVGRRLRRCWRSRSRRREGRSEGLRGPSATPRSSRGTNPSRLFDSCAWTRLPAWLSAGASAVSCWVRSSPVRPAQDVDPPASLGARRPDV